MSSPVDVVCRPPVQSEYLGDGVYAEFDGSNIVLRVPADASNTGTAQAVYLDSSTFAELIRYRKKCYGQR
jgi:hypothetical protein